MSFMNGMKLIRTAFIHKLQLQYIVKEKNFFIEHISYLYYNKYIFFVLAYQPQSMHNFKSSIQIYRWVLTTFIRVFAYSPQA